METALVVAQVAALVCLSVLSVVLIVVLFRVKGLVGELQQDLRDVSARAVPVLDNLESITSRVKAISENIDEQVGTVRDSIASIKSVADNIVDFERKVQDRVEGPVLETVAYIAAVIKGLRAFLTRMRA